MICKVLLPLRKRPPSEQENGQKLGKKKKASRKGNTNDPEQRHLSLLII